MAKRKKLTQTIEKDMEKSQTKLPVFTHRAFQTAFWFVIAGFAVQIVLGILVYPTLPDRISTGFLGSPAPYNTIPKLPALALFPAAEIILFLITIFTPKDEQGKRIMETGMAWSMVLLALLFTALQASAFHIPYVGR